MQNIHLTVALQKNHINRHDAKGIKYFLFSYLYLLICCPKCIDFCPNRVYNIFEQKRIPMKKKNVLNLIKYYSEKNDNAFRNEAYEIAKDFYDSGDNQLAEYIMALISNKNAFVPQIRDNNSVFLKKVTLSTEPLPLPDSIKNDIVGLVNAINRNVGINKFLFEGYPGTGKTETVSQIARIIERDLYAVDFSGIIDSRLGQTQKNMMTLFDEVNNISQPDKIIILFDEIDAIALDRINNHDVREMGRATSSLLKGLDSLNSSVVMIATTNLYNSFDKALIRRFDAVINFNRYTQEDLVNIAEIILNNLLLKFKISERNTKLFKKIIKLMDKIPYPGELKNLLKTSIAFSSPNHKYDYLIKLFENIKKDQNIDLKELQKLGFTVREIEILTGVSKSQVSRELKDV